MIKINWDKFKIKNENYTLAFESVYNHIFCRRYGLTEGIKADFNQTGLETESYQYTDGKYCVFQSKFFDEINYINLDESISKAL